MPTTVAVCRREVRLNMIDKWLYCLTSFMPASDMSLWCLLYTVVGYCTVGLIRNAWACAYVCWLCVCLLSVSDVILKELSLAGSFSDKYRWRRRSRPIICVVWTDGGYMLPYVYMYVVEWGASLFHVSLRWRLTLNSSIGSGAYPADRVRHRYEIAWRTGVWCGASCVTVTV